MKRNMPSSLITWLLANPNCHRADCFVIELPTGGTLYATSGQFDLTLLTTTPGWASAQTTFKAVDNGVWTRGKIISEASTKVASNTMDLMCVPKAALYPGVPLGILQAAYQHLFDAATVFVFTAYMPIGAYGNVVGVETKFQGTITRAPKLGRTLVQFECADPLYLLNMKVPSRLIQSNCPWTFGDVNCTLNVENFTAIVAATTTDAGSITAALTQPDGYFAQGVVKCLTGANAGLSQTVKSQKSGVVALTQPWILPVRVGDTFSVLKGCDKSLATCGGTVRVDGTLEPADYKIRYGGTPFVPAPSSSV